MEQTWTAPSRTWVRPDVRVMDATRKVSTSNTNSLGSHPNTGGKPATMAVAATAGMVSPMLESAEPGDRFRLVCRRLGCAARKAAQVSGNNTNRAITMPNTESSHGAPSRRLQDCLQATTPSTLM